MARPITRPALFCPRDVRIRQQGALPIQQCLRKLSEIEARRINLEFAKGQRVTVSTANGQVNGHRIQLDSVRVGEAMIYGVSAIVLPQPMPAVLLGNSFLNRFQMQRTNDQLTLERRY